MPIRPLVCLLLLASTAAAAEPDRKELLKTFVSELVEITPGEGQFPESFIQGSTSVATERLAHEVRMSHAFAIAKYEVPQNLYEAVMGANPSRWKGPRNSAEMMSWSDANQFCARLTDLLRAENLIAADEVIRLPTESEWEYACRAGTSCAYSFGEDAQSKADANPKATLLDAYAWHHGNAAGNDPAVGALKPNPWGLYDVHGYLWEYCADPWHPDYTGAPHDGSVWADPAAPPAAQRVIRGGSWKDEYPVLRSASRRPIAPDAVDDAIGFRCVKSRAVK